MILHFKYISKCNEEIKINILQKCIVNLYIFGQKHMVVCRPVFRWYDVPVQCFILRPFLHFPQVNPIITILLHTANYVAELSTPDLTEYTKHKTNA